MEIVINGQPGLASTDSDVTLGELFQYMRRELGKQRLVVRAFIIDGQDVDIENDATMAAKMPDGVNKLEIEADRVEIVAHDILGELVDKAPLLAKEAVTVTELIQSGEAKQSRDKLLAFVNSTLYIVQALHSINNLVTFKDDDVKVDGVPFNTFLNTLTGHLRELATAVSDRDFATVGDIMEFDISGKITALGGVMATMKDHLAAMVRAVADEAAG